MRKRNESLRAALLDDDIEVVHDALFQLSEFRGRDVDMLVPDIIQLLRHRADDDYVGYHCIVLLECHSYSHPEAWVHVVLSLTHPREHPRRRAALAVTRMSEVTLKQVRSRLPKENRALHNRGLGLLLALPTDQASALREIPAMLGDALQLPRLYAAIAVVRWKRAETDLRAAVPDVTDPKSAPRPAAPEMPEIEHAIRLTSVYDACVAAVCGWRAG